jgi:ABC-2 type transport system ATP-binding protein
MGTAVEWPRPVTGPGRSEPVIDVRDLRKAFDGFEAVRGITFDVAPGELFAFLGPNGAGKTTTISILCTLLRPTSGTARVAGLDVVAAPLAVRSRIGLVFQDPTLDEYLTAAENLRFHAQLYGVPRTAIGPRVDAVLDMVGLADRRDGLVRTFSGGMKRRLEIARGLLHSPRVLFLDEPTIGLDPQTRSHIWEYVDELRRREAITILLTTHYMEEAEGCDRLAIIDRGELVAIDTPDALKAAVGKDRVELQVDDPEAAIAALANRFGIEAALREGAVAFHATGAEALVPTLVTELGVPIRSIRVARPTLDDVFMTYTGSTLRDAEASGNERLRSTPMVRAHRGR